jgi:helix-turn-helix protein
MPTDPGVDPAADDAGATDAAEADDAVRDRLIEGATPTDSDESTSDAIRDAPAGVTHPARKGGRVTDTPAVAARLTLTDETLVVREADGDLADFGIRFADIIYLRDGQQEINGEPVESLVVRHIDPPANAVTTKLSLWDDAAHDRLTTVVTDYYRQHREAVAELELSTQQLEILVTAYSAGREFDPATVLPKAADDIAALFEPLRRADLLRRGDTGVFLTGRGHMVVNERVDDKTM